MGLNRVRALLVVDAGRTSYERCWRLQQQLVELRATGRLEDVLLLTEHQHVYTIGKTGDEKHLRAGRSQLGGVPVVHNDRGGDITYHGPGQLVGYPILDLRQLRTDLAWYLRGLEEIVIRTLERFGVHGSRIDGYTGVWVGDEKICAIGIKTTRWITMHGFALNVNTELSHFANIVPCGISDKGVTSMEACLGASVRMADVASAVVSAFVSFFDYQKEELTASALSKLMGERGADHAGRSGTLPQFHGIHEVKE
jgi:lipoyl(octanoyl) transferase